MRHEVGKPKPRGEGLAREQPEYRLRFGQACPSSCAHRPGRYMRAELKGEAARRPLQAAMMLSRTGPACPHPKQRTLLRPPPTASTSLGCSSCSHQVAGFALRTKAFLLHPPPPPQSPHKVCIFYEIPG